MLVATSFSGALEIAGFLIGIGTAGAGFGVLIGTVSRATPEAKRSQTVGIVAAAGSLGTMVLAPLGQGVINGFGWQTAMFMFAAFAGSIALLSIPMSELGDAPARKVPQTLPGAGQQAIGHKGYLFMTLAIF